MIFSFAFVCEHESSIGGYKGPTMYGVSMKAPFVVIRVQPCIGVSMKTQFVVIRVQPCFDLGLLGTLGQVWVSLGTSQVHNI